jgi:EAL domain-containing protein (putative c-di-GMP-specific phosphodiesterase class I)
MWEKLFGRIWEKLTEVDPNIGAFLAVKDSAEVSLDNNAISILNLSQTPSYDDFMTIYNRLAKQTNPSAALKVYPYDSGDENITAGFIRAEQNSFAMQGTEQFQILTQSQLISQMTNDLRPSLLALVKLEGVCNQAFAAVSVASAIDAIKNTLPERAVIARQSREQIWIYIPDFSDDAENTLISLKTAVESCVLTDEFGVVISENHPMTLSIGASSENSEPKQRMRTTSFALFEALANGRGSISVFSTEQYEMQKSEYHNMRAFTRLVENNLFIYHFQPIVSARTGEIVAYEALMRTDETIGLNPAQILNLAEHFGRLYDIEKATLNNTLAYLSNNQEIFEDRKLFVNSISACMLSEEDYLKLRTNYGELLEKVVIELTEQTEISDAALSTIHKRLKKDNMHLAIDDYGTGYSNTTNLLRYNPDYVKIDRSLITNIDSNHKTQKIVSGIIDFLHASGYLALAEGVETSAELRTMINFGADLIQGYYVSRPKPVLMHEISEKIQTEIIQINLEADGGAQKIYRPTANEAVDLAKLAMDKYTDIFVEVPAVTLVGANEQLVSFNISVKDDTDSQITLNNAVISSITDAPVIRVGNGCNVRLICQGDNKLDLKGILVPMGSSLRISGAGSLDITSGALNGYAIGCDCDHSYGNITIDMTGSLNISVSGERCIGIGGGKNGGSSRITLAGGATSILCSGGTCVGIGNFDGNSLIDISDCSISVKTESGNAIAVGSISGNAEITFANFSCKTFSTGGIQAAIGVLNGGSGNINMRDGEADITVKGKTISCVGSRDGEINCTIDSTVMTLYCEGSSVSGIGDKTGGGDVSLTDTAIELTFLTGDGMAIGSQNGKLSIIGGTRNIKINE